MAFLCKAIYEVPSKDEKFEVATQANELLKNANDISLDNKLIIDVWGYVLHYLLKFDIMRYKDFDRMQGVSSLTEDQLECIFTIFNKVVIIDGSSKGYFAKVKFAKDNINLFNKIVQ